MSPRTESPSAQTELALICRCCYVPERPAYAPNSPPAFAATGTVAGGQALTDATLILEGLAASQTPEKLYLRIADHQGSSYIDTGRTDGKVVRIRAGTWSVIDTAPVRFLRTKLTAAMPLPARDSDLDRLWDFINVAVADRPVLLAVLVAALIQCDVPHPVLALFAEQGSAKRTTTRMLVDLIDPSPVPLRQAPRDADTWVHAASGSWVVALDNLSAIPPWLSDSLCRAATGDGNVKRALYTDGDLAVVKFRRCVIVNGIDVGAVRPDLAERMVLVDLRRIDRHMRQPEATLRQQWREALPGILSCLRRPHPRQRRRPSVDLRREHPRPAAGKGVQVILTTFDGKLAELALAHHDWRGLAAYELNLLDIIVGTEPTQTADVFSRLMLEAEQNLHSPTPAGRSAACGSYRRSAERLAKQIIATGRTHDGRPTTVEDVDDEASTLGDLVPLVSGYAIDNAERGRWRSFPKLRNPGNHDDEVPSTIELKQVRGNLRSIAKTQRERWPNGLLL